MLRRSGSASRCRRGLCFRFAVRTPVRAASSREGAGMVASCHGGCQCPFARAWKPDDGYQRGYHQSLRARGWQPLPRGLRNIDPHKRGNDAHRMPGGPKVWSRSPGNRTCPFARNFVLILGWFFRPRRLGERPGARDLGYYQRTCRFGKID